MTGEKNIYSVRVARHSAFSKYISGEAHESEIALIMNELDECTSNSSDIENVLALQLCDYIEEYMSTLSTHSFNIFIKRYFYMEAISTIATDCKITEAKVANILKDCRDALKAHLATKGYIFKSETLFEAFSNISDSFLIEGKARELNHDSKQLKSHKIGVFFALIACVAIVAIIISALILDSSEKATIPNESTDDDQTPASLDMLAKKEFLKDDYVDIDRLLSYVPEYPSSDIPLFNINYYDNIFTYRQYELENNDILQYLIDGISLQELYPKELFGGLFISDDSDSRLYQLIGHPESQYLVRESEGEYTLWEYIYSQCDDTNTETYAEPLRFIYDLYSSGDITEIIVSKPKTDANANAMDTELMSFKDYESINYIFYVMSNMICYGCGNWDIISGYPEHDFEEIFADSVQLYIVTPEGNVIDCFYYSDIAGCFYEFDHGIAYSKVSDNAKKKLYELFYSNMTAGESSYSTVLATYNIYSADDISSIALSTLEDTHGQATFSMITDAGTIEQIYDILSNMAPSSSNEFEQSDPLYGSIIYDMVIFDSGGGSTELLTFYGTYRGFYANNRIYNLNEDDASFFSKLGYAHLTDTTP